MDTFLKILANFGSLGEQILKILVSEEKNESLGDISWREIKGLWVTCGKKIHAWCFPVNAPQTRPESEVGAFVYEANCLINSKIALRGHNWVHFAHRLYIVYCYLEFKLRYLKNLQLFSIRVKELFQPIVLRKKGRRVFALFIIFFLRNRSLSNAR